MVVLAALISAAIAGCSDTGSEREPSAFVQLPDSRLIKVQSVGLAAFGPINPHTAMPSDVNEAFGVPTAEAMTGPVCRRRWASLGLRIDFGAAEGIDDCGEGAHIERLAVRGKAAAMADWRTAEGIRPLQPVSAVERIYPEAGRVQSGGSVLVETSSKIRKPPVLVVTVARGRVRALSFPIGPGPG